MLTIFNIKLHPDDLSRILAICLLIPAYMQTFVSKEPLFQFIGYLAYLIPITVLIINKNINISVRLVFFMSIFSFLLILSSLVNSFSGRLESDLINFKGLFTKLIFLVSILFFFDSWYKKYKDIQWEKFIFFLLIFMLPMIGILFFETLAQMQHCTKYYTWTKCRPDLFGENAFIISELFLLFILLCLTLQKRMIKISLITLSFITLIFLQARAAMLGSILAIFIFHGIPLITKFRIKIIFIFFVLSIVPSYLIFNLLVDYTFVGRGLFSLNNRLDMWQLGFETIKDSPLFGIGFDVTPNFYGFTYNHGDNTIHNIFIRIAAHNGLPVLFIIISIIAAAIYYSFKRRDIFCLACILSLIVFNFFSTRHISINLANTFLYFLLIRAFLFTRIRP
jgi:O-antigen ligase